MPGVKQPCPMVAACWSPAMPQNADRRRRTDRAASCRSRPRSRAPAAAAPPARRTVAASSASHCAAARCRTAACATHWWRRWRGPCRRSAATAGSCRPCRTRAGPAPPPRARRRRGRAARRSWSRRNTDRAAARSSAATAASWPAPRSAAQASAVRRSCQTMALWIGLPVARSQTTVVSRWLVMPMPAMSLGARRRPSPSRRARSRPWSTRFPPDRARPSPAPDRSARIPAAPTATGASAASNTIARVEVVPWSMANEVGMAVATAAATGCTLRRSMNRASASFSLGLSVSPSLVRRHSTSSAVCAHSCCIR